MATYTVDLRCGMTPRATRCNLGLEKIYDEGAKMNIALPVLLLVFGGLTFWILSESKIKWYFKSACITTFCVFTIIFWMTIHTFLGWSAREADMPEKMLIHWVIIKEPNKLTSYDGAIYILSESVEEPKGNKFIRFYIIVLKKK